MTRLDKDKLEARRLRYFMQVLEIGSVRGAAGAMGMDASAVSRAISLLESECGAQLFERRGRGIVPTDAGHLLAGYIRRQHSEKQSLLEQLDSIRKVETGHVELVTGEGYIDWLMRRPLSRFMQTHPKIAIDLRIESTDGIVERVLDERAHIGILFNPPRNERLHSHYSQPHPIQTLVLRTHPLAQLKPPLRLSDLLPYAGATLHQGFGLRQHIQAAELSEGTKLTFSFTTTSFDALGHFVLAGLGYSLVSRLPLPPADAAKVISLPMKSSLLHRGRSHVVTRQGRTLPPAAAELLRIIVGDMKLPGRNAPRVAPHD